MFKDITPREREVFDLLLEGLSQKEIANKLNISHSTLDFHRTNLYRKLGVHSIKELFAKYSTNGKTAPSEPEAALPVPETKEHKKLRLLLPAGIALGIIMFAFSVLFIGKFVIKPSPEPKGAIIPVYNMGFFSYADSNAQKGNSTCEIFISSEEIDGVEVNSVLNIKTNLVKREDSDIIYASVNTKKSDLIQQLRQANGIRFKTRGDGKSWSVDFFQKESTQERNHARYSFTFGTVRDQVGVVYVPYSKLTKHESYDQYSFDFNKETIKEMFFLANPYLQGFGSSSLQIFDFEIY
jgi:DNA-binding CsgD family transcriptional regulator